MHRVFNNLDGVDTRMIRKVNLIRVFDTIRNSKDITISELAKKTDLTPVTVKGVLVELENYGLIEKTGIKNSRGGRKPGTYSLKVDGCLICTVWLHTNSCETALMTLDGQILSNLTSEIDKKNPQAVAETIQTSFFELCTQIGRKPETIIGMGITQPGILGNDGDVIRYDVRHGWIEVPLKHMIEALVPVPVYLIEEANSKLAAEIEFGRGGNVSSLLYVLIGGSDDSGVSGSMVINGELITGRNGLAGEIGHTVLDVNGPDCYCGRKGCWEAITDMSHFIKKFQTETSIPVFTNVNDFLQYLHSHSKSFENSNLLHDYFDIHAQGITNLIHIFNPEKIIIGGGITLLGDLFLNRIKTSISSYAMAPYTENFDIEMSKIEEKSGFLGALSVVLNHVVELCREQNGE